VPPGLRPGQALAANDGHELFYTTTVNNYISRLAHLGVIEVNGEDAASFLQAQLTSEIDQLADQQSQFSAWCNPRGRVIANFIVTRSGSHYFLIIPVDLIETICKRLKMFVLRARVSILNRTDEYGCLGVYTDDALTNIDQLVNWDYSAIKVTIPQYPARTILISARNEMPSLLSGMAAHGIEIVEVYRWQLLDIQTGVPWIYPTTSEQLLPQELDLENTGALSYNKGCYPGQEIIARLHFRGQVKRGLYTGQFKSRDSIPVPGMKLFTGAKTRSIGILINSVRESADNIASLAVINIDAAGKQTMVLEDGGVFHPFPRH